MYNLTKNNYHLKPKNSTIYTPLEVSQFIFELLKDKIKNVVLTSENSQPRPIIDPCSGMGSLLVPWKETGYYTWGVDIDPDSTADYKKDFLSLVGPFKPGYYGNYCRPALILCNPPFNGMKPKLASEVWLDKIIELFGKEIPLVLFAPMGFRLNGKKSGQRWTKFTKDKYPAISSIISLPRDIFPNTEFHSEILIFNIKGLEPHYFFKPNHE